MRYTVSYIDIENARAALALDANKSAAQIRAIAERRGMEAQAALDASMIREDFDSAHDARRRGEALYADPGIYDVTGLAFDGATLVECFGWEAN